METSPTNHNPPTAVSCRLFSHWPFHLVDQRPALTGFYRVFASMCGCCFHFKIDSVIQVIALHKGFTGFYRVCRVDFGPLLAFYWVFTEFLFNLGVVSFSKSILISKG